MEVTCCGLCQLEIILSLPWFKCVECSSLPICYVCFASGKENECHRNSHAYKVAPCPDLPVFTELWSSREEEGLLDGVEKCGIGNWEGVSESVGSKDASMCKEHYHSMYLADPKHILDQIKDEIRERENEMVDTDRVLRDINKRLIHMSGVKLAGYLPFRDDYDREFLNCAESLLVPLSFTEDDIAAVHHISGKRTLALQSKLDSIEDYNCMIRERKHRKIMVKNASLLDDAKHWTHKPMTNEESSVREALRVFERFSSHWEHERLVIGLTKELKLSRQTENAEVGLSLFSCVSDISKSTVYNNCGANDVDVLRESERAAAKYLKIKDEDFMKLKSQLMNQVRSCASPMEQKSVQLEITKSRNYLRCKVTCRDTPLIV